MRCTKRFAGFPFAHRQPTHDGHCALIHGHNWDFEITFEASVLDENGFVIDFGKLQFVKNWLAGQFDHTLVLPTDDPQLEHFTALENRGLARITLLPGVSAESLAKYVREKMHSRVQDMTNGRVSVPTVTVYEDEKNSATASV